MKKFLTPQRLFAFAILGLVVLTAACRAPAPTSTPVPPTSNAPTALPPAPTAPPLTAAPTDVPPTAAPTAVLPTDVPATAVVATSVPAATNTTTSGAATPIRPATAASGSGTGTGTGTGMGTGTSSGSGAVTTGPLAGLTISALRYDPTYPVKNTPIMFYATITNTTGKEQYYPICAEIFRPDAKKSFGITNCDNLTMVPGTSEIFVGSWIATGIKDCLPMRARAVLREADEDDVRLVVPKADGGELWVDFQMCP